MSGAFCSLHPAAKAVGVFGDSLLKNLQTYCRIAQYCAILAGFADRSVVAQVVEWFIKNIQPISVGV